MRYFICALGSINLGIPAEQTERIIPLSRAQTNVYETDVYETEASSEGAFISLPALFRQGGAAVHGLVLKNTGPAPAENGQVKTILLAPKIDTDLEIPEDAIHALPETFAGVFSFIRGAYFDEDAQNLILILDPKKITEVHQEKVTINN